jgi:hypothetical protein
LNRPVALQMEKPDAPGRLPGPGIEFTQTTDALGMLSEGPPNPGPTPVECLSNNASLWFFWHPRMTVSTRTTLCSCG